MNAELGDIVSHKKILLLFIEETESVVDKKPITFCGIPLSDIFKDNHYKEKLEMWDGWLRNCFTIERKATPDEILKAIVKTKKEDIRDKLKKLLKERL